MDTNKIDSWLEANKHLTGAHNQRMHGNRGAKVSQAAQDTSSLPADQQQMLANMRASGMNEQADIAEKWLLEAAAASKGSMIDTLRNMPEKTEAEATSDFYRNVRAANDRKFKRDQARKRENEILAHQQQAADEAYARSHAQTILDKGGK